MKYTLKTLSVFLSRAPGNKLNLQGSRVNTHIVSCKHAKYNTPLYVVGLPKGKRDHVKLSGNPARAIVLSHNTAANMRDDLLENYRDVVISRAA